MGRAGRYIPPYKFKFLMAFFCVVMGVVFGLIQPLVWGKFIASLFKKNMNKAMLDIAVLLILYTFQSVISYIQAYVFSYLSENVVYDMKRDMYKKILDLPVKGFDEMRVGEFISRMQGDTSAIANVITNQFLGIIVDVIKVLCIGIAAFSISIPLAVILIVTFPISYYIFVTYGKKLRAHNRQIANYNDKYFSNIEETISGIREVKSLGVKEHKYKSFLEIASNIKGLFIKNAVLNNAAYTLSQAGNFVCQILVMAAGAYFIVKGKLSIEYFIAFTSYSSQFSFSLINITRLNSTIQQILTSLERVFGLMDNLSYSNEEYGEVKVENIEGNIAFKNISFQYKEGIDVLENVSFSIGKHKKVAIVGPSGSGKTTLFNLLIRFYEANSGDITIDNINIKDFNEETLRNHIAIVRQEPYLFKAAIRENLLMASSLASEEEMMKACKAAGIHEYIMRLPKGYDSVVGDKGINPSTGQKQRIAIARALIKKSKIILFDEATSALDNEAQSYIKQTIDSISKNYTVVIIAHRLSTVIGADEIIVLEKGKVVGQGTHNLLLSKNATYKRLYEAELDLISNKREVS